MNNKKTYENKCFSPNWIEIDLDEINDNISAKEVNQTAAGLNTRKSDNQYNKETRLESKRRKDLNTLLKELNEIKEGIERAAEKQHRLANLMSFYTGEFAK